MNRENFYLLGRIIGTHGVQGATVCRLDVDSPEKYKKMESLLVEINKQLVPFFIKKVSIRGSDAIFNFEDIESIDRAKELIGCPVYLPLKSLPALTGNSFYFHEIKGYTVVDKNLGKLGEITEILEFPQQVIAEMNYKGKEVLFPIHDHFFVEINREKKEFHVQLPEGLIEVYM